MKDVDFISTYLAIDEDGDYVLKELPCAFLGEDNFCSIYDFRPKACREFPHTDSPKQSQLFDLLIKNTYECPAALKIVEEMNLTVVGYTQHQFQPYGATLLYLLAESHLSIHTYVEERYCAIDLYCCSPGINMDDVLSIIYDYFGGDCIIKKNILKR